MLGSLASIFLLAVAGPPTLPDPDADLELDTRLRLRWPTIAGCPSAEEVGVRVTELAPQIELGDDGTREAEIGLERVAGSPPRWAVEVRIEAPFGVQRNTFEAESCAVAADAVALLIAVALDPVETVAQLDEARRAAPAEPAPAEPSSDREPSEPIEAETVDPGSASSGDAPRTPASTLVATDDAPPAASEVGRLGFGLALLGGGGFGPLRAGSAAIVARFAVFARRWRWQIGGVWLAPVGLDLGQGWTARFDGWLLGTRACGVLHPADRLELPLCGGVEAGAVRGRPLPTLPTGTDAIQPWLAVELGPALSWSPRPRLALGVELDAVVPLLAAAFTLGGERVRQYSPVGVRALAAIELRLGPAARGRS
jgi:hypothetical protein